MLSASLAILAALQNPILNLERGGPGDDQFRYWAATDTFIDSAKPSDNFGRDPLLSAGPGKTLLFKFDDLARIVGKNKRVRRARLILRQEIGDEPALIGAYRMNTAWGEGPGKRGLGLLGAPLEPGAKSPNLSATWDSPNGGLRNPRWQAPGARGLADRDEIKNVSGVRSENVYVLDGLAETVQQMMEAPDRNFGFALEFRNVVDFRSSEATSGRPVLQIETEEAPMVKGGDVELLYVSSSVDMAKALPRDGENVTWTAHFRYGGPGSTGPMQVAWTVDGKETMVPVANGLADGQTGTVSLELPFRSTTDHRTREIYVRVETGASNVNRANDSLRFLEAAVPVTLDSPALLPAVSFINRVALPMSRFSFALDGARTGVRVQAITPGSSDELPLRAAVRKVLLLAGLADLAQATATREQGADRNSADPFPGALGGGDTRNDEAYPGVLGFPAEPWFDSATAQIPFEATDLLAATDIAQLHARLKDRSLGWREVTPKTSVIRLLDGTGGLIKNARMEFYRRSGGKFPPVPTFTVEDSGGGIVALGAQGRDLFTDLGDGVLMVRVSRLGNSATGFLKAWQLVDAFARGNTESGIVPIRVALPAAKASTQNSAVGRIVEDSAASSPAKLDALVDEKPETSLPWAQNKAGFIVVDLQKDRAIARVQLTFKDGKIWDQFRVMIYSTGQKPESARPWATETAGRWMLANRGDGNSLDYFGPIAQVRYVRLEIPAGTTEADLAELKVFGLE